MEESFSIADSRASLRAEIHNVHAEGQRIQTGVAKFGALIGDHSRIGANAVLSPGTVLAPDTVVARLGLVDQGVA